MLVAIFWLYLKISLRRIIRRNNCSASLAASSIAHGRVVAGWHAWQRWVQKVEGRRVCWKRFCEKTSCAEVYSAPQSFI